MTWLTAIATALLVDVSVLVAAASGWWATTGLLHLDRTSSLVLATLLAVPAVWAVAKATRLAFETRLDGEDA